MGGVGRGEEGLLHPEQRPQRPEMPLVPHRRVCAGTGLLIGRREPVLRWGH